MRNGHLPYQECSSGEISAFVPIVRFMTDERPRFKLKLRPKGSASEGDSALLIKQRAVERGILALPGVEFFPNAAATAYVRASFSLLEEGDVDEGLRRLASVIKEYNDEVE